jgi:hypothetical protein
MRVIHEMAIREGKYGVMGKEETGRKMGGR